jgi:hypothetical protein
LLKSPLPRFRDRGTAAEFYGALAAAEIPFAVNAKKLPFGTRLRIPVGQKGTVL